MSGYFIRVTNTVIPDASNTNNSIQGGEVLGAGFNAFTDLLILDSPTTGTFSLPGALVVNAVVSFDVAGGNLSLAVNNLADKEYYKGYSTINPQRPRNTAARFTYGF